MRTTELQVATAMDGGCWYADVVNESHEILHSTGLHHTEFAAFAEAFEWMRSHRALVTRGKQPSDPELQ